MKYKFTFLFFFLGIHYSILSQTDSSFVGRWTIKASAALVQRGGFKTVGLDENLQNQLKPILTPSYRLEASYGFAKNMELGLYIGSNKHQGVLGTNVVKEYTKQIGLTYNYHLLPLIIKDRNLPVDVYLTARFGGIILTKLKESKYHGFNSEYGVGIGVNYFFLKNFGVYADYLFGDFNYRTAQYPEEEEILKDFDKIRAGFVLKF